MVEAYYNCLHCMNKKVRILTRDGGVYEGTVVKVDRDNVYLKRSAKGRAQTSAFIPPYGYGYGPYGANEEILTLSLFTLLAIALI
ncbi:hypothetical protein D3C76_29040 [compost metagenome]|uniref:Cellobiose phosphorylase n=2 Tax=Paenibacillus TaxID=44249 RepID=A0A9X1Y5D3_9BACL|nr:MULTISPECIES: hypothetical protein [Paenibacillus]MBW4840025.1 hypothetical protein [Paenibacillaceae bacterium]MBM6995098.1 hypothetical protein [Paenibacillus rhizolycopersici]MCK8487597.1 hypothetical protein [Paenibacillus mellifer]MUG87646.1 hypothetical protein [Paenibacillus timonensis]GIP46692.1 hypothetical protein J53TS2_02830 [Paenibacillus sp. J53TS2]